MELPELFPSAVPVATARSRLMDAVAFNWLPSAPIRGAAEPGGGGGSNEIISRLPGASASSCDGADPLTDLQQRPRGPVPDSVTPNPATTMSNVTIGPASRHARTGYPIVP